MTYGVTEVFSTLQGEGSHTGKRALFVRFAGCNLWTGDPARREQDAERTGARCPRFCDTDFSLRHKWSAEQLREAMETEAARVGGGHELVVFTGGEPLLQLDDEAVHIAESIAGTVAVETNGTVPILPQLYRRLWVVCSPKVPQEQLKLHACDELKVVFPTYDPLMFAEFPASMRYIQPEANPADGGLIDPNIKAAAQWVVAHPGWRLSVQTHKGAGLP